MDTEQQATTPREDLDTLMEQMRGYPPARVAAAVWDWMGAQGFREKAHTPSNGSCWDAAPQIIRDGVHDPMPPLCELTAGHLGAHRSGQTEWMRSLPHTPTDDEREAPTEQDWRAAHQDGGVIFAKVKGSPVPVLLMRGRYGDWSSETKRYRSTDVEEVIKVYRWVPAGMQGAWASELVADFRRSEVLPEPSADWDRVHDRPADIYTPPEDRIVRPSPQGEPSDAQVDAVKDGVSRLAGMQLMHRYSSFGDPWWDALYGGIARVALRAIGGVR